MSRTDILDACTKILTNLVEVVHEMPDVRARIHSIKVHPQNRCPGASNKENTPTRSAFTPVVPGRAVGQAQVSGVQAGASLRSMSESQQSSASYLGFLLSSKAYDHFPSRPVLRTCRPHTEMDMDSPIDLTVKKERK